MIQEHEYVLRFTNPGRHLLNKLRLQGLLTDNLQLLSILLSATVFCRTLLLFALLQKCCSQASSLDQKRGSTTRL